MPDLSTLTREFVMFVDEQFHRSPRKWTPGTWVFGILLLAVLSESGSLIWAHLFVPVYGFFGEVQNGHALAAIQAVEGGMVVRTIAATITTLIMAGVTLVLGYELVIGIARLWRMYPSDLRSEVVAAKSATRSPIKWALFWIVTIFALATLFGIVAIMWLYGANKGSL